MIQQLNLIFVVPKPFWKLLKQPNQTGFKNCHRKPAWSELFQLSKHPDAFLTKIKGLKMRRNPPSSHSLEPYSSSINNIFKVIKTGEKMRKSGGDTFSMILSKPHCYSTWWYASPVSFCPNKNGILIWLWDYEIIFML